MNTSQLIKESFILYRHVFLRVFGLALILSVIAFIPRLITVYLQQDIFAAIPPFSLERLWLVLIDLGCLVFLAAIIWRIHCFMKNINEPFFTDLKIGLKKMPLVFFASILQALLISAILFFF